MYIVFDIGGTKTRIAASRDCKTIIGEPRKIDTVPDFDKAMDVFQEVVRDVSLGEEVHALAGGVGLPLNREKTGISSSHKPAFMSWVGKSITGRLSEMFGASAYLDNDSAMVGLGEAAVGAGMGHSIVAYITVSTGVGGAVIVDQKISPSAQGFEPGHQLIDVDKTMCPECDSGSFEDMVSGTATAKRFGMKAYEVQDVKVWDEDLPKWLAYGLHNTIVHWSPDVVVLGGSMIVGDPAISVPATKRYVEDMLTIFPKAPEIKMAELGDFGGIHGALAYIRQNRG